MNMDLDPVLNANCSLVKKNKGFPGAVSNSTRASSIFYWFLAECYVTTHSFLAKS